MSADWILGAFLAFSGFQDLYSGRVSRHVTGAVFLAGLALRQEQMAAGVLAGVLFFPLFLFRMLGAADVKMISLIVGFLGPGWGTASVGTGFFLGAVWSLARLLRRKILLQRLSYFFAYIRRITIWKTYEPYYRADRDGGEPVIPLAFCFSAGTGLCFLAERLGLFGR